MCGLYGYITVGKNESKFDASALVKGLAVSASSRGKHATGISYNVGDSHVIQKSDKPASEFVINLRKPRAVMGHTRHTTQGSEKQNYNNHPFSGDIYNNAFSLAHNGVLDNDYDLQKDEKLPYTDIETDSYVAVQLLEKYADSSELTHDLLKQMAEKVSGMFAFTILDSRGNLAIVRNNSDFYMVHIPKKDMYVYGSTKAIVEAGLRKANLDKFKAVDVPVTTQEIVLITHDGYLTRSRFTENRVFNSRYYSNASARIASQGGSRLSQYDYHYGYGWEDDYAYSVTTTYNINVYYTTFSEYGFSDEETDLMFDYYTEAELKDALGDELYANDLLYQALRWNFDAEILQKSKVKQSVY